MNVDSCYVVLRIPSLSNASYDASYCKYFRASRDLVANGVCCITTMKLNPVQCSFSSGSGCAVTSLASLNATKACENRWLCVCAHICQQAEWCPLCSMPASARVRKVESGMIAKANRQSHT